MSEMKVLNMTSKLVFPVLAIAGFLSANTGCQQDPYADKPETIRRGIPPEADKEPPVAKPVVKEALRIDSSDFYSFKEGVESEISISGRVLLPNTPFDLDFENLKDFPGAKFDATTGVFKWNPPRETTGNDYGVPKRLVARLTTKTTPVLGTTKEILVYVTRAEIDPDILSVDDLVSVPTREGELKKFTVTVRDPDAADIDGARPRLVAVPNRPGTNDVAGLVFMEPSTASSPNPIQDPADKTKWKFKMKLDLSITNVDQRGRNFTRTEELFYFGLQLVNRYGRMAVKNVDAKIRTDVMRPECSWSAADPIEVVAGLPNTVQFTVYDPYNEGKLDVYYTEPLDRLPGGNATGKCTEMNRDGAMLCRINWTPPALKPGVKFEEYDVQFEGRNQSKVTGDTKMTVEKFKRKIRVTPGAGVIITPTPPVTTPVTPASSSDSTTTSGR